MLARQPKMVRPDIKGRISLGGLAKGVSRFVITQNGTKIILEPYVEIPAQEQWLFQNKIALMQVKQGLQDSANGRLINRGKFKPYRDEK